MGHVRPGANEFLRAGALHRVEVVQWGSTARGIRLQGLIDCGAATSMIRPDHANRGGLQARGERIVWGFDGAEHRIDTFPARVTVDGFSVDVVVGALGTEALDFIIGRDILRHAALAIDGPLGVCTLTFPSPEPVVRLDGQEAAES